MTEIYTPTYNQHKNPRVMIGDIVRINANLVTNIVQAIDSSEYIQLNDNDMAKQVHKLTLIRRGQRNRWDNQDIEPKEPTS